MLVGAAWLMAAAAVVAGDVRLVRYADGKPFHMGKVTSMRIVSPDTGAKLLTLNLSISGAGSEFSQHVHDDSDDTILVLEGAADLRQGDNRAPMKAGICAFVPQGQIHGTITTADDTVMISTQTPPDLVLYTGARDSSKPGAAAPKGAITPGAVKYVKFDNSNGYFVDGSTVGARRVAVERRKLRAGEQVTFSGKTGGEQLVFVWKGSVAATGQKAGERDTLLWPGGDPLSVTAEGPAEVIHIRSN